jgi:flavin reductase (DIM6/NTAB) family NADH-FMN oxidoreductase RutF
LRDLLITLGRDGVVRLWVLGCGRGARSPKWRPSDSASMDALIKRKALRMLSNGLYVLTSRSGESYGVATVTWVSQASFKPPLLMAAVRRDSNVYRCLAKSGVAALHVLAADQQELARKFFFPSKASAGMLNGEPFVEGKTMVPVLCSTPAHVECRVNHIFDALGDHSIVILEVINAELRREACPLTIRHSPWEYGG